MLNMLKNKKIIGVRLSSILSIIVIGVFSVACFNGCLKIKTRRLADQYGDPFVSFKAYLKKKHYKTNGPVIDGVYSELYLIREGRKELLNRSQSGSWRLFDLIPGKYELHVDKRVLPDGTVEELNGNNTETFRLATGESAEIRVILEKTPVGLIVILSITVVVFVALLVYLITQEDLDVDLPDIGEVPFFPRVPSVLIPPAPPVPGNVVIDLVIPPVRGEWYDDRYDERYRDESSEYYKDEYEEPAVIDYYPVHDKTDVDTDASIKLKFNRSMDYQWIDHRNFVVRDHNDHIIPGGIYSEENDTIFVYNPLRPLPVDEKITVTVLGDHIRDKEGEILCCNYRWSFQTSEL